jgi:hypothetical protein
VGQKGLLLIAAILGFFNHSLAKLFSDNAVIMILSSLFILLFLQEAWIVQWKMRDDNIAFTRRFNRKFPPTEFSWVRISPNLVGFLGASLLGVFVGAPLVQSTLLAMFLTFFILKWLSDPLLGCFADYNGRYFQPMFAYVVIYIYAASSSFDSVLLSVTPLPWLQSLSMVMFFLAVLQLRMAYYQKFCFKSNHSVEGQMNVVLFSLLFLSLPRLMYAIEVLGTGLR